jgi:YD repeat-containing protein
VSWRLEHDNMVELYHASGVLAGRQWADGRRMSVVYSDASTPVTIAPGPGFQIKHVDGFGRELNFQYDAAGNLQKLIDPAGRETIYTYEPFGVNSCAQGSCFRLKSVQYPDSTTKQYHYNEPGYIAGGETPKLTGITDERGVRIGTYSASAIRAAPARM